eukprot:TRINITY_DN73228_c0_g1_i1.p1 TRINITY_DN73228_c0_g1~~TRINITY_DN73228_c0_g1_i1.p1  ORF type:complete len:209 (-),score=24.33 TRINITY_DN73228_c0_g1_i1:38-664(-)
MKGNGMLPNNHFRKHWQLWTRTYFHAPMRKKRRARTRIEKARRIAPRPAAGPLRPVVRCPRNKYNKRERLGRGFSLDELDAAGLNRNYARTIGIAVDYRRKNRNVEAQQQNVQRLKEYMSKLILFPRHPKKPRAGDASPEEVKMATQLKGTVMPIDRTPPAWEVREVTDEEKNFEAFKTLYSAWREAKFKGKREKAEKDAAEAAKNRM